MSSMAANNPDLRAQQLVSSYVRAGYTPIDPPVVQPAEPFLDLSGEDIRRRMFLTSDPLGRELCLRPDLTIPVSRAYLQSPAAGKAAGYCYLGAVFRHREGSAAEFLQAGIESFGRQDKAAADAEMLSLGLEATTLYGLTAPEIRVGDVGLFSAFVAALDLAPAWKRRLIKDFNRKWSLAHDLDQLALDRDQRSAGISGRARRARRLRSEGGASSRHRPSLHRRHCGGRRPFGCRDRRALSRTSRAWRRNAAAARDPRADRALPRRARRSRRSRRRTARARRRRQALAYAPRSICSRRAPAFSPRAASTCARSISRRGSAAASIITPASCSRCMIRAPKVRSSPAAVTTAC